MNETLKALFESAGLPADFPQKASVLFEAAVNEAVDAKVAEQVAAIQESAEKKFDEAKAEWLEEQNALMESFLDSVVVEWAKENAVALDAKVKTDIAESVLSTFRNVLESQGFKLPAEKSTIVESAQAKVTEVEAKLASTSAELAEAQAKLISYQKAEVIAEATEGLSDVATDRVASLAENVAFKDLESFKKSVAIIAEAFGKKVTEGKSEDEDNGEGDGEGEDKGVDGAGDGEGEGSGEGEGKGGDDEDNKGEQTNESFDIVQASLNFIKTGKNAQ